MLMEDLSRKNQEPVAASSGIPRLIKQKCVYVCIYIIVYIYICNVLEFSLQLDLTHTVIPPQSLCIA